MIYFTGDHHFGHRLMVRERGFSSIDEMNQCLITAWNEKVQPGDTVIHLGDFFYKCGDPEEIVKRLNGKIILVKGNHDYKYPKFSRFYHKVCDIYSYRPNGGKYPQRNFVAFHYPIVKAGWPWAYYNSIHLHAHSHGKRPSEGLRIDVGVDSEYSKNYSPISEAEIIEIARGLDSEYVNRKSFNCDL